MARHDPFCSFRFLIEFDRLQHGGFSRVKGVSAETKVESYHEGGLNELRTQARNDDQLLQSGAGARRSRPLPLGLASRGRRGPGQAPHGFDHPEGHAGAEVKRWHADGAYPVKWSVTDFDAMSTQVLFESVEFAHHGLRAG